MRRKLCQRSGQCPWRPSGFESTKLLIKSLLISYKWINDSFVEPGVARLEGQGRGRDIGVPHLQGGILRRRRGFSI